MPPDLTLPDVEHAIIGRPEVVIDLDVVERAASIGCTVEEISALVGCSRRTMFYKLKDEPEIQEAMQRGLDKGRATLRRQQWQRANSGSDTMLIWLGKQMLGQRDVTDIALSGSLTATVLPYDPSTLDAEEREVLQRVLLKAPPTIEHEEES
jgi:hypothetical protein